MKTQHNPAFDVENAQPHAGLGTGPVKGEEEAEDDLPITANRSAQWWYIAVHKITAMVGSGVLGLPYAMGLLGVLTMLRITPALRLCALTLMAATATCNCNLPLLVSLLVVTFVYDPDTFLFHL